MRRLLRLAIILAMASLGCPAAGTPVVKGPTDDPLKPGPTSAPAMSGATTGLLVMEDIPPDRRVWAYLDGERRIMDMDDARSRGMTIVDLSDDWVPYIFWSKTPGKEDYKENAYLDAYVDLANDRIDVDGVALDPWEKNYLEVYGIPPSLGVLRRRFLEEEKKECYRSLDYELFRKGYFGPLRIVDAEGSEREAKRYFSARGPYLKALRRARVKTVDELAKIPKYSTIARAYEKAHWRYEAIRAMQQRLVCEGMFGRRTPAIKPGVITWAIQEALKQFERKHNIFGWGMIFQNTAEALGRTPLENNFESLKRVLSERVVSAARILEDGTVGKASYRTASGKKEKARNLVEEFSAAFLHHLGLTSPQKALAFMKEHSEETFSRFFVAVKLPPYPEYYADQMDFSVVIDRGDIWYDLPFDDKGRPKSQPRSRFPHLTLFVTHQKQQIPLVRWRTTVGGWQPEMRHEQEYYKYKISDVGPRVWKNIIAGPVWVPPDNTPSRDKVKIRPVRNRTERIVAHQTFGPGYASAYGLVAAFHVTKNGKDNQVRTHGSVNYMSMMSSHGFSHGCHRLFNYRAVRLFSFILAHRQFERKGQTKLGYAKRFEHLGEEFNMDLDTRGYYYELTPPVPVNVLEGNIRGELKEPIEDYVKKPTVVYQEDLHSLKKKAPSGAPRVKPKENKDPMRRPQNL